VTPWHDCGQRMRHMTMQNDAFPRRSISVHLDGNVAQNVCDLRFARTQDQIVDLLLARAHMGAASSLEPVLALLGTLARDLRADFLPLLPRVLERVTQLVELGELSCADISPSDALCATSRSCCRPCLRMHAVRKRGSACRTVSSLGAVP
jgi:hypothetical protein